MILVLKTPLFFSFKLGGLAFGQDVIYLAPWLELNFGFRTVSLDSRMIKAKCFRHLLSMFSFQNSWSPTAFSQKENMASLELFFSCRKRSVLPIGFGKVSFLKKWRSLCRRSCRRAPPRHGSGPNTWGMNSAARIVNLQIRVTLFSLTIW